MTPAERLAKSHRAKSSWDEFFGPMIASLRSEYLDRMASEAASELHAGRRADKVTALAVALRVLDNLEGGMREAILDGEFASKEKLRADKIEQMTDAQQRLARIGVI